MTAMALGEPVGPISASIFSSVISFLTAVTDNVGSLASSNEMYLTLRSPIFSGSKGTVFFWGIPTIAVGPVDDVITPILTCATDAVAIHAASTANVEVKVFFIMA